MPQFNTGPHPGGDTGGWIPHQPPPQTKPAGTLLAVNPAAAGFSEQRRNTTSEPQKLARAFASFGVRTRPVYRIFWF